MIGNPARFHVAEMRERITIEKPIDDNLNDAGEPERVWQKLHVDEPAKWTPTGGSETVRGRVIEAGIRAIFTMRNKPGIDAECRLIHSSGTYGISYVKPVDGLPRFLEVHCGDVAA